MAFQDLPDWVTVFLKSRGRNSPNTGWKTEFRTVKIGLEEIRKVAALSRLEFSAAEEGLLAQQIAKILQYVEKLNEIDTTGVEPLAHVLEMVNAFREDRVDGQPSADLLLSNAPAKEKTFFKVPKILE
jgi:aspartyl-tRNA(Asn)/glutamyl-tRNA(Gln) amidotransferase subunit C